MRFGLPRSTRDAQCPTEYNRIGVHADIDYFTPDDRHDGRGEWLRQKRRNGLAAGRISAGGGGLAAGATDRRDYATGGLTNKTQSPRSPSAWLTRFQPLSEAQKPTALSVEAISRALLNSVSNQPTISVPSPCPR